MDSQRFDDIAKALATGLTRRAVLRRLGAGIAGLGLAAAARRSAEAAPSECAVLCADQPGARGAQCRQTCKKCAGGPAAVCPDAATGGFACADVQADPANCGACGVVCGPGEACCGGACVAVDTTANCGACGAACDPGWDCCGGVCTRLFTNANCAACGDACTPGTDTCSGLGSGGDPESGCCAFIGSVCDPAAAVDRCCNQSTCTGTNAAGQPVCCGVSGASSCFLGSQCCSGACGASGLCA